MQFLRRSSGATSSKKNLRQVFSSYLSEQDATAIANWQVGKSATDAEPALDKLLRGCPQTVEQQLRLLGLSEEALLRAQDTAIKRRAEVHESLVVVRTATERIASDEDGGPSLSERLVSLKQAHETTLRVLDAATEQVLRPLEVEGRGVVDSTKATASLLDKCSTALEQCQRKGTEANGRLAGLLNQQTTACRNLHKHIDGCTARRQAAYAKVLTPLKDCEAALKQLKAEKKVHGLVNKVESALKKGTIDEKVFDPKAVKAAGVVIAKIAERVEAGMSLAEQDIKSLVGVLSEQEGRTIELRVALTAAWRDVSPSIEDQPPPKSVFQQHQQDESSFLFALPKEPMVGVPKTGFSAPASATSTPSSGSVMPHSLRLGQNQSNVKPAQQPLNLGNSFLNNDLGIPPPGSGAAMSKAPSFGVGGPSGGAAPLSASDFGALKMDFMDPKPPVGRGSGGMGGYPAGVPGGHSQGIPQGTGSGLDSSKPLGAGTRGLMGFDLGDISQSVRGSMETRGADASRINAAKGQSARIAAAAKNKGFSTSDAGSEYTMSMVSGGSYHASHHDHEFHDRHDRHGSYHAYNKAPEYASTGTPGDNVLGPRHKATKSSASNEYGGQRSATGISGTTAKTLEEEHEEMKEELEAARKQQQKLVNALNKLGLEDDVDSLLSKGTSRRSASGIFGNARPRRQTPTRDGASVGGYSDHGRDHRRHDDGGYSGYSDHRRHEMRSDVSPSGYSRGTGNSRGGHSRDHSRHRYRDAIEEEDYDGTDDDRRGSRHRSGSRQRHNYESSDRRR